MGHASTIVEPQALKALFASKFSLHVCLLEVEFLNTLLQSHLFLILKLDLLTSCWVFVHFELESAGSFHCSICLCDFLGALLSTGSHNDGCGDELVEKEFNALNMEDLEEIKIRDEAGQNPGENKFLKGPAKQCYLLLKQLIIYI